MSSITFGGVPLVRPSLPEYDRSPITNVTTLASGRRSVQASDELGFSVTFTCYSDTYSDVTDLRDLIGSANTLVIDGVSYPDCFINGWKEKKIDNTNWQYTVGFVRDTT